MIHGPASRARPDAEALKAVRGAAHRLERRPQDFDLLMRRIADARVVLLGEATHGTHEFYRARAELTRRLIEEKQFDIVAVEADWPDAYRVNRWIRALGDDRHAEEALSGFRRFPTWMWRNSDVLDFVGWLRDHNDALGSDAAKVGFYGLDLYALNSSIDAVLRYLDSVAPELARQARERYACFDHVEADAQSWGYEVASGLRRRCEREAVQQLVDLRRRAAELITRNGRFHEDEHFYAEQNARLIVSAEAYYRVMFRGRVESWNLRDRHMADTLGALIEHFLARGRSGKAVVWAHNSHVGDARATEMGSGGEWNVGQLARRRFAEDAVLVGFTTYAGTVTAASDWGGPTERKLVRPALEESFEALFHESGIDRFLLPLDSPSLAVLDAPRLERAIGVIYRPGTERASHYFRARLRQQFDAILHHDHTRALEPLERTSLWERGEVPETFPTGM